MPTIRLGMHLSPHRTHMPNTIYNSLDFRIQLANPLTSIIHSHILEFDTVRQRSGLIYQLAKQIVGKSTINILEPTPNHIDLGLENLYRI